MVCCLELSGNSFVGRKKKTNENFESISHELPSNVVNFDQSDQWDQWSTTKLWQRKKFNCGSVGSWKKSLNIVLFLLSIF